MGGRGGGESGEDRGPGWGAGRAGSPRPGRRPQLVLRLQRSHGSAPSRDARVRGGVAGPGPRGCPGQSPLQPVPALGCDPGPPSVPSGGGAALRTRCCWLRRHRLSLDCIPGTSLARLHSSAAPGGGAPSHSHTAGRGNGGANPGLTDSSAHARPRLHPSPHPQGCFRVSVLFLGSGLGCRGCPYPPTPRN